MNFTEYSKLDATGMAKLIRDGDVQPTELSALARSAVARMNPHLNGVIEVFETAEAQPERVNGALFGVPMLNKDLSFAQKGVAMEMGSWIARGLIQETDSCCFHRLRAAGLVNLGRTTTSEFGIAGVTETSISGITRNPWNTNHSPGGSSGGSAAMVAAGVVPVASASDGGGSIRVPAAHCGLVGMKPTRARIPVGPSRAESNNGLGVPFMLTRSLRDAALLLDVMHGPASGDPYGVEKPEQPFTSSLRKALPQLRIAVATHSWGGFPTDPEVKTAIDLIAKLFEADGHVIEEARPAIDFECFLSATLNVWCANTYFSIDKLARQTGRSASLVSLQSTTFAYYERGRSLSAADLLSALDRFNDVNRKVGRFFERYDLLLTPTSLHPPPRIGAIDCNPPTPVDVPAFNEDWISLDAFMPVFNTTGQPAISIPAGTTRSGLPVGAHLVGRFGGDAMTLRAARLVEQAIPWARERPPHHVAAPDGETGSHIS